MCGLVELPTLDAVADEFRVDALEECSLEPARARVEKLVDAIGRIEGSKRRMTVPGSGGER